MFSDDYPRASRYSEQIDRCENTPQELRKTIEEFVCPSGKSAGNSFDVAYQVVLSIMFGEIDQDVDRDIDSIAQMGANPATDVSRDLSNMFDTTSGDAKYYQRYMSVCQNEQGQSEVINEVIKHYGTVLIHDRVTDYAPNNDSRCKDLAKRKLQAFKQASWEMAGSQMNREYMKGKHEFFGKMKDSYDRLNSKTMILIGQWSTIRDKWHSKTKQTINSKAGK